MECTGFLERIEKRDSDNAPKYPDPVTDSVESNRMLTANSFENILTPMNSLKAIGVIAIY